MILTNPLMADKNKRNNFESVNGQTDFKSDLDISDDQRKFVGKKLTQMLDSMVEEDDLSCCKETDDTVDTGIKLFASSTEEVKVSKKSSKEHHKKQKRPKIRKRKLSESSDEDAKIKAAAVSFEDI